MPNTSGEPRFDAIVVAGASSARLGGIDKALLDVAGRTLLERALSSVAAARRIVVVGPARPGAADVTWCEEQPAGGGPVAAFAAGLPAATSEFVVLLAVDLPFVAPAVPLLLAAQADLAVLVDSSGRVNYLAAAWRRDVVLARLASIGDPVGASMRRLVEGLDPVPVPDAGGWSDDCDTWAAVAAARSRAAKEGI